MTAPRLAGTRRAEESWARHLCLHGVHAGQLWDKMSLLLKKTSIIGFASNLAEHTVLTVVSSDRGISPRKII